jgi:hypothetical protein
MSQLRLSFRVPPTIWLKLAWQRVNVSVALSIVALAFSGASFYYNFGYVKRSLTLAVTGMSFETFPVTPAPTRSTYGCTSHCSIPATGQLR